MAEPHRITPTTNTQPKRQRGDGRVFLRGNKLWCGFSVDGVEHRESTKTNDPIKAEKYLRMRLKEVHAHQFSRTKFISQRDHRRTIADLMDALKTNFELREKDSPQNLSNIRRVKKDFSIVRATNLTAEAIADYVRDQLAAGYAKATINRWTETLRQGFALAELPAPKIVKLDESDNVRRGFFSEAEIRAVTANLPADLADFTLFGWHTGMRKGEIASLRWEDMDGDVIVLAGKNAKNGQDRQIPCVGELGELIGRRRAARSVKVGDTVLLCDLVFHRNGAPLRECMGSGLQESRRPSLVSRSTQECRQGYDSSWRVAERRDVYLWAQNDCDV
jgi:integrase